MSQQARTAGSKLEGSCACGAVKVSVNGETMNGICREWDWSDRRVYESATRCSRRP
jgi:hypothetical protein